ncbi:MAG: hypothetical protein RL299_29 [Pseudomonadota bacterium]
MNIPQQLRDIPQWLVWRFVQKDPAKKPAKLPYYATTGQLRSGAQGGDDDRANLVDFETAMERAALSDYEGVGFAFLPGDGLIGIDLDGCFNTEDAERADRAAKIIRACASWAEYSPSGNGAHIIVRGQTETFKSNALGIEVFCGSQFFTFTGRQLPGVPDAIADIDPGVLEKLRKTVRGSAPAPAPAAAYSPPSTAAKVESALAMVSPDCGYDDWLRIGMAIHAELGPGAMAVWDHWSSRGSKYKGGRDIESHWRSFKPGAVTGATLFKAAMDAGWRPPQPPRAPAAAPARPPAVDPETGEITGPEPANDNVPAGDPLDIFAEYPAPPMEWDMVPEAIAGYAFECAELIGVEPAMVAMPALVACAAALHDDVRIQPKRHETDWTESARLWCAIVGAPSVRKSPAIKRATKRLRKIDMELHDENAKVAAQYNEQLERYKEAKKEARKTGDYIQAPEPPQINRMVVEDITVEALSEVLKDNSRGVLCIQDELSGWFGSMDAYSGGKAGGKDRAHWLESYNGGGRVVDRVMRGTLKIPNWSVSMIGGIQPDAIRRIAQNMTDDGLMQRFMIIIGGNAKEYDRPKDRDAYNRFSALVDHLYAVSGSADPVQLSEPAHQVRERLTAYAAELADYGALPGGLRSHLGKWSGLFARLLLIYHAIECAGRRIHPASAQVSGETAQQVDRLMRRFLLPHALAYYTDVLGASGDLEHARWIAGHALSKQLQTISNRDLTIAYRQWRGLDEWRKGRIMQMLEDSSWLTPMVDEMPRPGRKGASAWLVNPRAHQAFAQKAEAEARRRERIRAEIAGLQAK